MGVEFVVGALVLPLARRLGERWLDAAANEVDATVRNQLKRLVGALASPDPEERQREALTARADLVAYAASNPTAAAQLAELAKKPEVAVDPAADPVTQRLQQFWALLVFVFDRVASLGHPVALRGFLNCTTCVSVIDARTVRDLWLPPRPSQDDGLRLISLAGGDFPVREATEDGRPRVWLVRMESDDTRDEAFERLNAQFKTPRLVPHPMLLGDELPVDAPVELVGSIDWQWVNIARRQKPPPEGLSRVDEVVHRYTHATPDPRDKDPFYAVKEARGATMLREDLERLLRERWEADEAWRVAIADIPILTNAAGTD